jgi:hypothetical protein
MLNRIVEFRRAATPAVVAILLSATTSAVAGTWKGREVREGGTVKVLNPAEPIETGNTLALSEQWTAYGDSDDYLFGILTSIATDERGNVYMLDMQLNEVLIFSPEGEYLRSIGREGEGPGEFSRPSGLFMTADGNIAVLQRMPGKIVMLTPDGDPAGQHPMPETDGMRMLNDGMIAGDGLVLSTMAWQRTDKGPKITTSLVRIDPKGTQTAEYLSRTDVRDFSNMEMDEKTFGRNAMVWAAGDDGRVFASSDFDTYRIEVWNADGSLDRVIEREYEPRQRTEAEIEDATPRIQIRGGGGRGGEVKVNMSKTSRAIERIYPREDGTVWVVSSRGGRDCGEGNIVTFDVFDRSGKFVRQLTLAGGGDFKEDGLHLVDNRVFVIKGLRSAARAMRGMGGDGEEDEGMEASEPMSVVCYSMDQVAQTR